MIDNLLITPLNIITVHGGDVYHALKKNDIGYQEFGEAYFSTIESGFIKAWKRHTTMVMNIVVPVGTVRFVFVDNNNQGYQVEEIGENRYARITVPPGIWFGFKGVSRSRSLVLNIASIPHDSQEIERLDVSEIEYDWS